MTEGAERNEKRVLMDDVHDALVAAGGYCGEAGQGWAMCAAVARHLTEAGWVHAHEDER